MDGQLCNGCGRKSLHMAELGQNGLAFPRFYCNSPEWGFYCWERVQDLLRANGTLDPIYRYVCGEGDLDERLTMIQITDHWRSHRLLDDALLMLEGAL